VNAEYEMKWQQFLPSGDFKNHPQYGWRVEKTSKEIVAIHFNSGAHIYFKTYAQNVDALQTGSCHALFCDEELPVDLYDELIFRISATEGYFHMVFTATLGQDYWRLALDPGPRETENLPEAFKQTVSMYDCLKYEDGSATPWNLKKIKVVEARCKTHKEVLKRVHGKFIQDSGLKYPAFDVKRHMKPEFNRVPHTWLTYAGVDIGSGGEKGHPAAIVFVAVRPDFRSARVIAGWRGDGIPTTASDVVTKFMEMKKELGRQITAQYYDWASKDFDMISMRMGEPFIAAEKSHEKGEEVVNVLFKNDMLYIYENGDLHKLAAELLAIRIDENKKKAKDDYCDALRYALTKIPFDWSAITGETSDYVEEKAETPLGEIEQQMLDRRREMDDANAEESERLEDEISEWNEAYGE
jgi:phage terminase large subunit-like protein